MPRRAWQPCWPLSRGRSLSCWRTGQDAVGVQLRLVDHGWGLSFLQSHQSLVACHVDRQDDEATTLYVEVILEPYGEISHGPGLPGRIVSYCFQQSGGARCLTDCLAEVGWPGKRDFRLSAGAAGLGMLGKGACFLLTMSTAPSTKLKRRGLFSLGVDSLNSASHLSEDRLGRATSPLRRWREDLPRASTSMAAFSRGPKRQVGSGKMRSSNLRPFCGGSGLASAAAIKQSNKDHAEST